jgi:hypothetical protein
VKDKKVVNVVAGEVYILELEITNPYNKKHLFKVEIKDDDLKNGHINHQELTLVDSSHSEWEKWVN